MQLHPDIQPVLDRLCRIIHDAGGRPLLVGGCVRDLLLGTIPKDLDIEIYGLEPERLLAILQPAFEVDLAGQAFGVLKIRHYPIDLSLPRRESKRGLGHRGFVALSDPWMTFAEAAARRDFTINAIAMDPATGEILDPFHGQRDLDQRVLRHISPHFGEDPLRVLRGMQLVSRFQLTATPDTIALSRELIQEYCTLSQERIWEEWSKWARLAKHPSLGLRFLQDTGWLSLYPELAALQDCPQEPEWHPEGDVWTHTLFVVDEAARIAERDGLDHQEQTILILAALCHDLGKPSTTALIDGRIRSRGHSECDQIVESILARLGTPKESTARIIALVRHHLSHTHFDGSPRHVRRLTLALGKAGESLRMLARLVEADSSGRPPLPKQLPASMCDMLKVAEELTLSQHGPRPLLLGRHLLAVGMAPGPQMGTLLREAYEAQLDGIFETVEAGLTWLRTRHPPMN
jgi:tRNA nucleotidyltransferase (CCA-adding enzyme)